MLERLDFWLAIFTLGALAWYELRLGRFVRPLFDLGADVVERSKTEIEARRRRRPMRLKPRPIRGERGRFDGSLPALESRSDERSNPEPRSDHRSAVESPGTTGTEVPIGTILPEEIALIGLRLGQGLSPSDVAKSLPGYSARKYKMYMEKVQHVQTTLAELVPTEEP